MKILDKLLDKLFCTEYSPLVEEDYQALKNIHPSITKRQVYKIMVNCNLIDKEGNPTDYAIKNGYIAVEDDPETNKEKQL